ncbi:hypothetical protein JW710_04565 [Candidatus Dojkabacteria bacterium]|nr:hypothetical protein [Candidatus Dojkabacteria bacterium]
MSADVQVTKDTVYIAPIDPDLLAGSLRKPQIQIDPVTELVDISGRDRECWTYDISTGVATFDIYGVRIRSRPEDPGIPLDPKEYSAYLRTMYLELVNARWISEGKNTILQLPEEDGVAILAAIGFYTDYLGWTRGGFINSPVNKVRGTEDWVYPEYWERDYCQRAQIIAELTVLAYAQEDIAQRLGLLVQACLATINGFGNHEVNSTKHYDFKAARTQVIVSLAKVIEHICPIQQVRSLHEPERTQILTIQIASMLASKIRPTTPQALLPGLRRRPNTNPHYQETSTISLLWQGNAALKTFATLLSISEADRANLMEIVLPIIRQKLV